MQSAAIERLFVAKLTQETSFGKSKPSGPLEPSRGVELGGDARDVSLPVSSDYQTVPSNNFDQTIKYMYMFL